MPPSSPDARSVEDGGAPIDFDRIHDLILDLAIIQQLYDTEHPEFRRIQTLIEDLQLLLQLNTHTI